MHVLTGLNLIQSARVVQYSHQHVPNLFFKCDCVCHDPASVCVCVVASPRCPLKWSPSTVLIKDSQGVGSCSPSNVWTSCLESSLSYSRLPFRPDAFGGCSFQPCVHMLTSCDGWLHHVSDWQVIGAAIHPMSTGINSRMSYKSVIKLCVAVHYYWHEYF